MRFVKPLQSDASQAAATHRPSIISASKDATISAIDIEGNCLASVRNMDGFACMDVLAGCPFPIAGSSSSDGKGLSGRLVVAADIKQNLQIFLYNEP